MKKMYINFDYTTHSCGLLGHFEGVKGYAIVNDDGSHSASECVEALNRILYVLKHGEGCVLITFGDGSFIGEGLDRSYGRLIRHWGGGKLGYVIWDKDGSPVKHYEGDGSIPDRKLARSFLDVMIAAHVEANS